MAKRSAKHLVEEMRSEPLLFATIRAETSEEFLRKVGVAKVQGARAVELRTDLLKNGERKSIPDTVQMSELPVIATCRKRTEGGKFAEDDEAGARLLKDAMGYGAQFVDISANTPMRIRDHLIKAAMSNDVKIIMSRHDMTTPSLAKMREIHERVHALPHDMIKLVFTPQNKQEAMRVLDVAQSLRMHKKPYTVFGMGPYGRPTRVFSLMLGGSFMYCSLESNGRENNLYQTSIADMKEIFGMIKGPTNWKFIRKDPEWIKKDLAKEWALVSDEMYNNMHALKKMLRDEIEDFLERKYSNS